MPSGIKSVTKLEWSQPDLMKHAHAIAGLDSKKGKTGALHRALQDDWDAKHQVILHRSQPTLPKRKPPVRCWVRGQCFCGQAGREGDSMGTKLSQKFRSVFGKGKALRPVCDAGAAAVLLVADVPEEGSELSCDLVMSRPFFC